VILRHFLVLASPSPTHNKNVWVGASIIQTRLKVTWAMQITISELYS